MTIRALRIDGAYEITPRTFSDSRGSFHEAFKRSSLTAETGVEFTAAQANTSVSAAGVIRGIHFADVPPGQAKYVTCPRGAILDVIVDIRIGSSTFGVCETVLLDDESHRAVYVSEGLGHGFIALEDNSIASYLVSSEYNPDIEHGIDPFDAELAIAWPTTGPDGAPLQYHLSANDRKAPSLARAVAIGLLPHYRPVAK